MTIRRWGTVACMMMAGAALVGGCSTVRRSKTDKAPPPPDLGPPIQTVQKAATDIAKGTTAIRRDAGAIRTEAAAGQATSPDLPQWPAIDKRATSIDDVATDIGDSAASLIEARAQLDAADAQIDRREERVKAMQADLSAATERIAELEAGETKYLRILLSAVIGLGLLLIAGGTALAVCGRLSAAFPAAAAGIALTGSAYFLARYAWVLLIVGSAALLALLAFLVWSLYRSRHTIEQLVQSFEVAKHAEWSAAESTVNIIQDKTTKADVRTIRDERGLKASAT